MLNSVAKEQLEIKISQDKPFWPSNAVGKYADKLISELDGIFDKPVYDWVCNGKKTDIKVGEFSTFIIMSGCKCDFITSVELLNDYLNDEKKGSVRIFSYRQGGRA